MRSIYADALTRLIDAYRHEKDGCCSDEDREVLEEVRNDKMLSDGNDINAVEVVTPCI